MTDPTLATDGVFHIKAIRCTMNFARDSAEDFVYSRKCGGNWSKQRRYALKWLKRRALAERRYYRRGGLTQFNELILNIPESGEPMFGTVNLGPRGLR